MKDPIPGVEIRHGCCQHSHGNNVKQPVKKVPARKKKDPRGEKKASMPI